MKCWPGHTVTKYLSGAYSMGHEDVALPKVTLLVAGQAWALVSALTLLLGGHGWTGSE